MKGNIMILLGLSVLLYCGLYIVWDDILPFKWVRLVEAVRASIEVMVRFLIVCSFTLVGFYLIVEGIKKS